VKEFAAAVVLMLLACVFGFRHGNPLPRQPQQWKLGYWIWAGDKPVSWRGRPQILYVQVAGNQWPRELPEAESYIAVRRIEPAQELSSELAKHVAEDYRALGRKAGARGHVEGLQIDYDSPTGRLKSYGRFLSVLRQELPSNAHLSITALLDWFVPNTAIADVLRSVDEFVPQFYDAGALRTSSGIAEPIDVEKWAPIFNAFQTPYRIGISSFGRVARRRYKGSGQWSIKFFRDAGPLDFAGRRELKRSVTSTPAGETVLRYEAAASMTDNGQVEAGDVIEITLPTESSVRSAYEAVRRFGGYCAGAVFFRWPNRAETLALTPAEVTRVIEGHSLASPIEIEARDASCIERRCSDLYLHLGRDVSPADRNIEIRSDHPSELFLRDGPLPSLSAGADRILVRVPAYSATESVYLGRVISEAPLKFKVVTP
jgi:hypothetical protein